MAATMSASIKKLVSICVGAAGANLVAMSAESAWPRATGAALMALSSGYLLYLLLYFYDEIGRERKP